MSVRGEVSGIVRRNLAFILYAMRKVLLLLIGVIFSMKGVAQINVRINYDNKSKEVSLFLKNEVPGVEIPDSIIERMSKAQTKEDGVKIGIEIAHEIKEKIDSSVQGYQISAPFGRVDLALQVIRS